MLLVNLSSTLPGIWDAASAVDPDHSLAGLVIGCAGGWFIARLLHERARVRADRERRKSSTERR